MVGDVGGERSKSNCSGPDVPSQGLESSCEEELEPYHFFKKMGDIFIGVFYLFHPG